MLVEWFNRARAIVGNRKTYLPPDPRPNDIYLTSYPRSGNTWTRFLLANYLTGEACDFDAVYRCVPDLYVSPERCAELPSPRFLKSHEPYVPEYRRVIYIVRDGRDVAVSYYFYCRQRGTISQEMSFDDYLTLFNRGQVGPYGSWSTHLNSWLDNLEPSGRLLLIRYRDLKEDTAQQLRRILEFAGLDINVDRVERAVTDARFERMQRQERIMRQRNLQTSADGQSLKAVRKGQTDQWQEMFSDGQLRRFLDCHGDALARLG
ncbi:sulfotransferase domain-containing protein [Persicimonas caeni]|uniref:Sulfotransferase domain-containing protein n=1 Tax=Persicimonas caeni TaxID=2292766 RepID=A0A4Y6PVD4_PERCE|nr:sulfotransferase domain-containing protein [Persicimonas caeni]QDG51705.1 sulfotransferase domain-containing protein [Persicimonas caeni]QED32926.1 sulfotransferase domain-containing protein [Persicimonas caeni]